MPSQRPRVSVSLLIVIVLLVVMGVAANYLIQMTATPEQMAKNVLLSAIPFILIFIAIILSFVALIQLVGSAINGRIALRSHRVVETLTIIGILFGIFGIYQPWSFGLYPIGFIVLLFSILAFILWSHTYPKRPLLHEE